MDGNYADPGRQNSCEYADLGSSRIPTGMAAESDTTESKRILAHVGLPDHAEPGNGRILSSAASPNEQTSLQT